MRSKLAAAAAPSWHAAVAQLWANMAAACALVHAGSGAPPPEAEAVPPEADGVPPEADVPVVEKSHCPRLGYWPRFLLR
ncbi:MAG: hypothetical protein SFV15_26955 [Polyangiaceae bacterium]|nr:hypothetical protein [Polyangiaceae bacterium]